MPVSDNRKALYHRASLLLIFALASSTCGALLYCLQLEYPGVKIISVGSIFNRHPLASLTIIGIALLSVVCTIIKRHMIILGALALLA